MNLSDFQPLPALAQQIAILEQYLKTLNSVLAQRGVTFDLLWGTDADNAAKDLADVMVHGCIGLACEEYSIAPKRSDENPDPWYWSARARYFGGSD